MPQFKLIKHRHCAWDSNPGRQDGTCRQIHSATAVPQTIILFEIFFKMGQIVLTFFTHQSLLETLFRFHWIKFRSKCKNISRQKCNKFFIEFSNFVNFRKNVKILKTRRRQVKKIQIFFDKIQKMVFSSNFLRFFFVFGHHLSFSVTRFGEISPLWQFFLKFSSNFVYGLFSIWQTFAPTLAFLYCWTYYHSCYCQRLNSHLVTLLQTKGGFNAFAAVIRYLRTSYEM